MEQSNNDISDLILTVGLDTVPAQQQLKKTLAEIKDAIEKAAARGGEAAEPGRREIREASIFARRMRRQRLWAHR